MGADSGALPRGEHSRRSSWAQAGAGTTSLGRRAVDLNTGAQWRMLPQCYPNYKTVHRRFQQWCQNDVLRAIVTDLANALREQGDIDERECFIDATFASTKDGGDEIGPTKRGKGVKIMAIVDRHGLPLSVSTHAVNHHEVTLLELGFDFYMIEAKPENQHHDAPEMNLT